MVKEFLPKNKSEAFSTARRSDNGLSLEYVKGIKFGDVFITPQKIQADAGKTSTDMSNKRYPLSNKSTAGYIDPDEIEG